MPKIKTHKGVAKTIKKRGKNGYKIMCPGSGHNTGKKRTKYNHKIRKGSTLSKADQKRLKNLI